MPTLQTIRRQVASFPALGLQIIHAGVQQYPPDGSYTGTATGSDATRTIVTSDLASYIVTGSGEGEGANGLDNVHVYALTNNPEQRRVVENGFTTTFTASAVTDAAALTATKVASILVERSFRQAIPPGTEIELHERCPVLPSGFVAGLHWAINQALSRMRLTRTLTLAGDDTRIADLTTYGITHDAQIGGLYTPAASSDTLRSVYSGGRPTLRFDGDQTVLELPGVLATGSNLELDLYQSRYSWIGASGGAFAISDVGLVDDDDECTGSLTHISMLAYYFTCEMLAQRAPKVEREPWAIEAKRTLQTVKPWMLWNQPEIPGPIAPQTSSVVRRTGVGIGHKWP